MAKTMSGSLSGLVLGVMLVLMTLNVVQARPSVVTASQGDIDRAWQHYWNDRRDWMPTAEFPHLACFEEAATRHDVPLTLLLAVARGESNFDAHAVSKADALGVMQILWPGTAKDLGFERRAQLFEPCPNIDAGARYLDGLLERYDDNVHLALAAYNYGPGRIEPGARQIQNGAAWYSGYILNHLDYVIGRSAPNATRQAPREYDDERRETLMTFWEPERAARFVAYLRDEVPAVRLDWFDLGLGRFTVDLLYQDDAERRQARRALRKVGIRL